MDAVAANVKNVFVKNTKTQPEPAPKKITKSRRVLPKTTERKTTAKATAHKTYPMGALKGTRQTRRAKLEPTNNPSKSPPLAKRATLRVLTPDGQRKQEQRVDELTSKLSVDQMRASLAKSGHPVSKNAPGPLVAEIYKAANIGGFLK